MSSEQIANNPEIKSSLLTIYDKIGMIQSREIGYELFVELIMNNIYLSSSMNYIISQVGDFIYSLSPKEKEPYLKLLSLFFYNPNNQNNEDINQNGNNSLISKNIYYIYISPVLNVLQTFINEQNSILYPSIANIYADIIQYTMPTDISASTKQLNPEEKKAYDVLQGFCIYNMKYDDKSNRIVGSLCLTKLVENCPIVLQPQYTKFIWDNINNFIDKKNFNAKTELLNCLISLILGAENLFCPYANVTLYKVLDFLTDNDWLKRKLALNVIYTLIFYCKDEILPLKDHIINFLQVLKTDKVKEVKEVCLLILQIFSQNESSQEKKSNNNYSEFSNQKNININNINNNITKSSERTIKEFQEIEKKEQERKNEIIIDKNRNKTPTNKRKRSIGEDKEKNIISNTFNHNKFVNRNDDNTFINEKMKIRPDPNKSIFKTNPNSAFFNQGKNNKDDIIVMAKGEPLKYNYDELIEFQNKKTSEKKVNNISNNKLENKIKTKYNRNKTGKQKENINKKLNENKKVDSVMINKLLLQMNDLSVKQLSLIDVMENIQTSATQKIKALNDKIFSLNSLIDNLTDELNELKNKNY